MREEILEIYYTDSESDLTILHITVVDCSTYMCMYKARGTFHTCKLTVVIDYIDLFYNKICNNKICANKFIFLFENYVAKY